jgi:hypothetical protein
MSCGTHVPSKGARERQIMKDDMKKVSVLESRKPKIGTEVPAPRIAIFEASATLKRRINRRSLATIRDYFKSRH